MVAGVVQDTARLVKAARRATGKTQAEFGRSVGKSQALVSKYENGVVQPPASVIMHCMNKLQSPAPGDAGTGAQWAAAIRALHELTAALDALAPRST